jgi:hypothetical protein
VVAFPPSIYLTQPSTSPRTPPFHFLLLSDAHIHIVRHSSASTASSVPLKHSKTGEIVGIVVGLVSFSTLSAVSAVILLRRLHQRGRPRSQRDEFDIDRVYTTTVVNPFTSRASQVNVREKGSEFYETDAAGTNANEPQPTRSGSEPPVPQAAPETSGTHDIAGLVHYLTGLVQLIITERGRAPNNTEPPPDYETADRSSSREARGFST